MTNPFLAFSANHPPPENYIRLNRNCPSARDLVFWAPMIGLAPSSFMFDMSGYKRASQTHYNGGPSVSAMPDGPLALRFTTNNSFNFADAPNLSFGGNQVTWLFQCRSVFNSRSIITKADHGSWTSPWSIFNSWVTSNDLESRIDTTAFLTPGNAFPLNTYHHVGGRYTGALVQSIVDGQVYSGAAKSSNLLTSSGDFWIGAVPVNASGFEGWITDVRVYNRSLSDEEIFHMYKPQNRWELIEDISGSTVRYGAPAFVPSTGAVFSQSIIVA